MNIRLQKTSDLITPDLRRKLAAVQDKKPYLSAMGLTVVELARRSFTNPAIRASAWASLKYPAGKKFDPPRGSPPKPLLWSRSLNKSLRLLSVSESAAYVGSDREYAAYQQLGTKHIPARPFFPFYSNGQATPRAQEAVRRALEARLRKRMKG